MVGDADFLAGESIQTYNLRSSSFTNDKTIEARLKKTPLNMKLLNNLCVSQENCVSFRKKKLSYHEACLLLNFKSRDSRITKLLGHLCHNDFPWVQPPQLSCHFKFSKKLHFKAREIGSLHTSCQAPSKYSDSYFEFAVGSSWPQCLQDTAAILLSSLLCSRVLWTCAQDCEHKHLWDWVVN